MKVPEVASARASGTNESNKRPAALSCAGAAAMSATSLLFAWLAAGTLRRCGDMDEEEVFPGLLWGLSPLICAYLFSWTVALSPAPRAKRAGAVSARAACLLHLGAAADKLIAPVAGAVAIGVAALYSACACGRALAEHRQRAGTERWSVATVASTPSYQSRAEEREERESKARAVTGMSIAAVAVAAAVLFVSWAPPPQAGWKAPPTDVVVFFAGPWLLAGRLMLPCMVGSPVLAKIGDLRALAAAFGVIGWLIVAASAGALYGTIAGAVVVSIGELGMLGFLGYFLTVEAHYKQLMAIKRSLEGQRTPPVCWTDAIVAMPVQLLLTPAPAFAFIVFCRDVASAPHVEAKS